ncbi:MAG: MFS transporter [Burkholderiales bacterium]|nr:MFS transporter [Burkholderiales bacterium]
MRIPTLEKIAFGMGNFFPTAVTATSGMAMYFYTDVAGFSAAFIGTMLLLVRVGDAVWDLMVGRLVDRTRTRWGQCRPFLLWTPPLLAVAMVASFTLPPWPGAAGTAFVIAAYVALWWCYSLVQIPLQSLSALMATDPVERLRLTGVGALLLFLCVIACGAGFPILKDALAQGNQAVGFQRAAMLMAVLGLLFTWLCFAGVRERTPPMASAPQDLRGDIAALWRNRGWRTIISATGVQATLIGLPLASGVYYFAAVMKEPGLIGPFMGLSGIGLVLGVVLSGLLTRRYCKKRVLVASAVANAVVLLGYLAAGPGRVPLVMLLAVLANVLLGVGAPITVSMVADTADEVERDSGRRVVGTLFATSNFAGKVGAGLCSGIVGAVLAWTHYVTGSAQQAEPALQGISALMGVVPALFALLYAALIGWGYPLGRAELTQLRDDLARLRVAAGA